MKEGDCFAIERGKYTGKFIVYVTTFNGCHYFLMMPGTFRILRVCDTEFKLAQKSPEVGSIPPMVNYVETVPATVFEILKAQYNDIVNKPSNLVTDLFGTRK